MDDQLESLATEVGAALKARELTLATAESCTGGWVDTLFEVKRFFRNFFSFPAHAGRA
jgi:nicotinamide mononucleotide (NMN) deamidase PncC